MPDVYATAHGPLARLASPLAARARERRHARFFALARLPADARVLDVGCGRIGLRALEPALDITGVDLQERGKEPVITPVDQLGVPTYDELVIVARRSTLEEEGERIRLFISALRRGTEAAAANPKAATEAILAANSELEPKLAEAQVNATLPLLSARTEGKPYGWMNPEEWEAFAAWMRDEELIEGQPKASELLSNAYLVDEIPE